VKYVVYFYISTFRSMCAVPNMAVFCGYLISCFHVMLLRYCLSDFEMVPVAPVIIGITFAFTFHIRWISITRSLHGLATPRQKLLPRKSNIGPPGVLTDSKDYYYYNCKYPA